MTLKNTYHDWYLLELSTDIANNTLHVTLGSDGRRSTISFLGVTRCLFSNFTIGNIVLDVYVISGNAQAVDALRKSSTFLTLMSSGVNSPYVDRTLEEIRAGRLVYAEIAPSYGCFGQIICESIHESYSD